MRTYKLLRVWIYLKTVNYIAGRCGHPTGHPGKEIVGKRFHKYIQKCKFMNLTAPKVDCVKHVYPKYNFYTVGNVVSFFTLVWALVLKILSAVLVRVQLVRLYVYKRT